jgi:uronate dehydrogenase
VSQASGRPINVDDRAEIRRSTERKQTPRTSMMSIETRVRPDTFYGVGKAAAEALRSLYHDCQGFAVACRRIGSFRGRPSTRCELLTWLSVRDAIRLVDACLRPSDLGLRIVHGISNNTRARWTSHPAGQGRL